MLDKLNNQILFYLEKRNWKIADIYWRTIGKHIPY